MKTALALVVVSLLPGCASSAIGLAVKAPLFGELQFRADPIREVGSAVLIATDEVGLTSPPAEGK